MSIIKIRVPDGQWGALPLAILEDRRLSLDTRTIAAWLATRPDTWDIRVSHLMRLFGLGEDRWSRIGRELDRAGYLTRRRTRVDGGRVGWDISFCSVTNAIPGSAGDGATIPVPAGHGSPGHGRPGDIVSKTKVSKTNKKQQDKTTTSPDGDQEEADDCPVEGIITLYHVCMPSNPKCKVLTAARRSAIRARWRAAASLRECNPFGYSTRDQGLAAWKRFFEICATSRFLTGRVPPTAGKLPFFADIDFLMSEQGFAKTLENHYHRDAISRPQMPAAASSYGPGGPL